MAQPMHDGLTSEMGSRIALYNATVFFIEAVIWFKTGCITSAALYLNCR